MSFVAWCGGQRERAREKDIDSGILAIDILKI